MRTIANQFLSCGTLASDGRSEIMMNGLFVSSDGDRGGKRMHDGH
jgi:hypothetical protein